MAADVNPGKIIICLIILLSWLLLDVITILQAIKSEESATGKKKKGLDCYHEDYEHKLAPQALICCFIIFSWRFLSPPEADRRLWRTIDPGRYNGFRRDRQRLDHAEPR